MINFTNEQNDELFKQMESLNEEQLEAATTINGPLLVLAGAGSGKTKSMTVRIANMIKSGISPRNILAMTFTNKAAGEMKERLISMVGEEAIEGIWMSTFHSACIKILRRHAHLIGYQKNEKGFATFSIYDPEDSTKLVKQIFKDLNIVGKHKEGAALSYIDTCKNKLWEPKHAAQYYVSTEQEQDFSKVYEIYQKELLKNNAIDFGDMIMKTVEVLRDHATAASYWQNKFHYLLIDEFQDSNYAQLQLILLLSSPHFNLFAVGDFRQSIYKFRGSDISIILGFKNMFPTGKVVHLLKNYRSQSNIVNVGNYLIDHNKTEFNKDLQAHHAEGKKVNVISVGTEFHEAAFAASTIKKAVMSGERSYKDFAILYRSNAQSRIIEDVFRNQFIPTKMVNGTGFYQREEIKDIVSYLRVLYNVKDSVALLRIMNKPARGIGKATQGKLETFAKDNDVSLFAALQRVDNIDGISKRSIMPIKNFFALMKSIKEDEPKFKTKSRFVEYVIQVTGLQKLYTGTTSELMEKEENLKEFVTLIAEFEATYPEKTLEDFIMEMSLSSSQVEESQEDAVKMMTIHASKGLEFPVVFCVAWSETIFPGFRAVSKEDIEEERRVAYVAITRAEEELYITHADTRRQMNGSMQKYEPSRFLSELPSELVHEIELFKHGEKKVKETLAIKEKTSSMGIDVSTIKDFDALSPEDKFRLLMEK